MVKMRRRRIRKKQKGGFFRKILHVITGGKDLHGRKRKLNPKFSHRRLNEPYYLPLKKQKGGFLGPDYNYTNTRGWQGWGNYWFPHQQGGGFRKSHR